MLLQSISQATVDMPDVVIDPTHLLDMKIDPPHHPPHGSTMPRRQQPASHITIRLHARCLHNEHDSSAKHRTAQSRIRVCTIYYDHTAMELDRHAPA